MKHTHKYQRITIGKNKHAVYRCVLPGCVHKIEPELLFGRAAICNKCGQEFFIDKEAAQLAKPRCITCKKTSKHVNKLMEMFS